MPVSASALFIALAHLPGCLQALTAKFPNNSECFSGMTISVCAAPRVKVRGMHFVEMKIEPEKMQYENNNKLQTCDAFHIRSRSLTLSRDYNLLSFVA